MASVEAAASGVGEEARAASTADASVEVHATLEALAALEAPWQALTAEARPLGPFLDFVWVRAWLERFAGGGTRPWVLSVRREGELIGIAPWVVHEPARRGGLRRIACIGAERTGWDHLDVLCAPHAEREVAEALYARLFARGAPRWQRLELHGVPAGSPFLLHFRSCFERAGKHTREDAGAYCPTVRLGVGAGEGLSAHRQKRLRYERQALAREGRVEHRTVCAGESGFDDALAAFGRLYRARWGPDPAPLGCVEACAARAGAASRLRIDLLAVDGRSHAGLLHLRQRDELFLYLMAVDREAYPKLSLGTLLVGLVLERAAAEGIHRYDFLRGGEDYKLAFADSGRRGLVFTAYAPGLASLAGLALEQVRALLKTAWR